VTTLQSSGRAAGDAEIAALGPWFHNLHLPDGRQTAPDHPLGDFPAFKWDQVAAALPADLTGAQALDIGCNAGFYSFELARRGARVLGIDHDEHYLAQARWARDRLGLTDRVDLRRMGVYELARTAEEFDVVLFMGVLYHLRYPLLALDIVAQRARGRLVLQTLTLPDEARVDPPQDVPMSQRSRLLEPGWPRAAFVERSLAGDPTNWWVPNAAAVEAMLRSAGLAVVAEPGHEIWVCERERPAAHDAELRAATGLPPRAANGEAETGRYRAEWTPEMGERGSRTPVETRPALHPGRDEAGPRP
jgi:tRNA (mo5U34)-methyltransferase